MTGFLLILAGVVLITIAVLYYVTFKNKPKRPVDYFSVFVIGIAWTGAGVPLLINTKNLGILAMGIIFILYLLFSAITEYFDLIDITSGSYGFPASYIFPLDDDESVDIKYVREYYGSNYIRLISGTVMKKVLIVFERGAFNPLKSMTVFELDKVLIRD